MQSLYIFVFTLKTKIPMENTQPSMSKSALNFGAKLGLVLMIISLINYVFNLYEASTAVSTIISLLSMAILAGGIYVGTKSFRDGLNEGTITYGKALGYGTLIALFAGIITSAFAFVYLGFIDDSFLQYTLTTQEDQMYEQGLPEEQIEMRMKMTKMFMKPGAFALMGILTNTFLGFIISLITAAILKKEPKEFA
jgi:hypothetical protein